MWINLAPFESSSSQLNLLKEDEIIAIETGIYSHDPVGHEN